MNDYWHKWSAEKPREGWNVVIVCDDGCSSSLAFMSEYGPLDGECGELLSDNFLRGACWARLPDSYTLAFMESLDDY